MEGGALSKKSSFCRFQRSPPNSDPRPPHPPQIYQILPFCPRGRSRHHLQTPFSEPLLRTLLRTPSYCKTRTAGPLLRTLLKTLPQNLSRTFSERFLEHCVGVRPLRRAPDFYLSLNFGCQGRPQKYQGFSVPAKPTRRKNKKPRLCTRWFQNGGWSLVRRATFPHPITSILPLLFYRLFTSI